jgi:UDPglucose--hexose-1-phosphate uridylyltransferase
MSRLERDHPHRRFNPLSGDWILVSPQRTQRPWQGRRESDPSGPRPSYDPQCYLCPGNARAGGAINPRYTETFVFANDFAAILPEGPDQPADASTLFCTQPIRGTCRVICFSPRHDLTLPQMSEPEIRGVIDVWAAQAAELGARYTWVQVFENKGPIMGCSNPHPHGQIWASDCLPNEPAKEDRQQAAYWREHQSPLLGDYLQEELARAERIVVEDAHWVVVVPFWATWPFETLLVPRRHVLQLADLTGPERVSLARTLRRFLTKCDNLFETSFPYSMGWHGSPRGDNPHWQLHAHFYPPLLRSATVKKFMVGYEMLAEAQRDLTPEQAAERLRELSETHYLEARMQGEFPSPSERHDG